MTPFVALGVGIVAAILVLWLPARGWAAMGLACLPVVGFGLMRAFC
jgi:hypothetical protein